MDSILQDLRYAIRSLRRTPGFTFTVVAVMALGIGVNAMIYTVVRGILFADLPFPEPERIVLVQSLNPAQGNGPDNMSLPDVRDVAEHIRSLTSVTVVLDWSPTVNFGGDTERFEGALASSGLPGALGVAPALGRWFTPAECSGQAGLGTVVISDKIWRERFAAGPGVLGRPLVINGRTRSIVGVMPQGFRFPENSDFFVPFALDDTSGNGRGGRYLNTFAHLAPGVTRQQAQAELDALSASLSKDFPGTNRHLRLLVTPYAEALGREIRPVLLMLLLAVTFVLAIACANVANLQLARATGRIREMGVRMALGATRGRIVRQLLAESLLLAGVGGALGVLVGQWGMKLTLAAIPEELPFWMHLELDPKVVAAVAGAAIVSGLLFGLAPALQASSGDILAPLREGTPGGGDSPARRRMRNSLVVAEIALAVVLLIGSGLMIRSFLRLQDQRLQLRTDGVVTAQVTLPGAIYKEDADRNAFVRDFRQSLLALPGAHAAGGVLNMHLGRSNWSMSILPEGLVADDQHQLPQVGFNVFTPGYLDVVGIPLVRGRDFRDSDIATSEKVALVSQAAAAKLWPGGDAIGKRWSFGPDDARGWFTVVGVIGDVQQHIGSSGSGTGEIVVPQEQWSSQMLNWAVRSSSPVAVVAPAMRQALRSKDANLALANVRTLGENIARSTWSQRIYAQLMGVFAALALVIAALGIYGVMAYSVTQRTREIGIRMALGAARNDVQKLILGHAIQLTLLGSGIGLAAAYGVTRFMQSMLFGVRPDDPPTFVGVTLILALSSAVAAWLPTARAVRVDPVVALRHE